MSNENLPQPTPPQIAAGARITIQSNQIIVGDTVTPVGYFLWDSALYRVPATCLIYASNMADRGINADIFDGSLFFGNLTVPPGSLPGIYTISIATSPAQDAVLAFRVSKTAAAGTSPIISNVQLKF